MQMNFTDDNPYASPGEIIRAELVEPSRPAKERNPVFAAVLLFLSLPFAWWTSLRCCHHVAAGRAGEWTLSDNGAVGALVIGCVLSLSLWLALPVCCHEIVQAIRRR